VAKGVKVWASERDVLGFGRKVPNRFTEILGLLAEGFLEGVLGEGIFGTP
jgi:hypothetical protein